MEQITDSMLLEAKFQKLFDNRYKYQKGNVACWITVLDKMTFITVNNLETKEHCVFDKRDCTVENFRTIWKLISKEDFPLQ